jgi:hypothetical protein
MLMADTAETNDGSNISSPRTATQESLTFFPNQVGGHTCILKDVSKDWIIKPMKENEANFYEMMQSKYGTDSNILEIFPKYYGIMSSKKINLSEFENFLPIEKVTFL